MERCKCFSVHCWLWSSCCRHRIHAITLLFAFSWLLFFVVCVCARDDVLHLIWRQMKSPSITTAIDGRNKTLYMKSIASIEQATRPNLSKSLAGKRMKTTGSISFKTLITFEQNSSKLLLQTCSS